MRVELMGDKVCDYQPRSQGLSSLPPLSLRKDNGGREERPWERGCVTIAILSLHIDKSDLRSIPK